jgi:SAM-dependent methyltransferase
MLQRTWPLPALLVWLLAWVLSGALARAAAPAWAVLALPTALGLVLAQWPALAATRWRAVFVAAGFPLSSLALAASQGRLGWGATQGALPAWAWLLPLGLLLLAYPMRAWRDAPVFPTPEGALSELAALAPLPAGARVLDAGCGLGDGLRALHEAYPLAQCEGIEWSWPLALWCRVRCPWAQVQRGDMWAPSWAGFDLVYLFQRPESMPKALGKALIELKPGAWLVSLEFEVPGCTPVSSITLGPDRRVWLYQPVPDSALATA